MPDKTDAGSYSDPIVAAYASALGSNAPTPGGGSAAAVTASFAAALGEKVCRLTIGKPAYAEHEDIINRALQRFGMLRQQLLELASEDEQAYGRYASAAAMAKSTSEEKALRKAAMNSALYDAASIPLEVARKSADVLTALRTVAEYGNRVLNSDTLVAGFLAVGALQGALTLVRANAALARTPEFSAMANRANSLEERGTALNREVQAIVDSRG